MYLILYSYWLGHSDNGLQQCLMSTRPICLELTFPIGLARNRNPYKISFRTLSANLGFFRPICLCWLLYLCIVHPQRLANDTGLIGQSILYIASPLICYLHISHTVLYLTLLNALCLICSIVGFYKVLQDLYIIMPFAYQGCIGDVLGTVKSRLRQCLQDR